MTKLTKEERELLKSFEDGEWVPVRQQQKRINELRDYAAATSKKDRRINVRISSKDLNAIQKKALEEGIPYQTLISSVLHKYVSGRLSETKFFRAGSHGDE